LSNPYPLCFSDGKRALAQDIDHRRDLPGALWDLAHPRPVLVLVGGANSLDKEVAEWVFPLFRDSLAPRLDRLGAAVIDGGTDSGVMALMGRARTLAGASFPLIGIAARGTVRMPRETLPPSSTGTPLEPNHTRFLLVPGDRWGDEAAWIVTAASTLARGAPTATLVVGGGEVTRLDLEHSLREGRPTLLLEGSGGTAHEIARASHIGRLDALGISADQARLLEITTQDCVVSVVGDLLQGLFVQTVKNLH